MRIEGRAHCLLLLCLKGAVCKMGKEEYALSVKFLCSSAVWVDKCEKEEEMRAFAVPFVQCRKSCL